MLRTWAAVLLTGVFTVALTDTTGWLSSDHATIRILFERSVRTPCQNDCERYALVVAFRGTSSPTRAEQTDWAAVSDAQCVDVVWAGRSSFGCRVAGSMAGTSKTGQMYATSRFHMKRGSLEDLSRSGALLRVQSITIRLPEDARARLAAFLRNPMVATSN